MKIICVTSFLLFFVFISIQAQKKRAFLLPDYASGTILMSNGSRATTWLNYDAANHHMMYKQKNEEMILLNTQSVDTIYVSARKFVPAGPLFLEVVPVAHGAVYVNWILKAHVKGSVGAYGQVVQTRVETVNTSYWTNKAYQSERKEEYEFSNNNEYWLFRNGKPVKCRNEKTLLKLFPGKEEAIRTFMKENGADFSNPKAVISVLDYCLGL